MRAVFKRRRNVRVLLAEVTDFDLNARTVHLRPAAGERRAFSVAYDTLIVAGGSRYSYFGHPEWQHFAPEVKSLESALETRARLLSAFEAAEIEDDDERRRALLTFVVVGAGPTGVEMAGQIAELAGDTLRRDFRAIDPREARILLIEGVDRVLPAFPPSLSAKAARARVPRGYATASANRGRDRRELGKDRVARRVGEGIPARTVIWAAASPHRFSRTDLRTAPASSSTGRDA